MRFRFHSGSIVNVETEKVFSSSNGHGVLMEPVAQGQGLVLFLVLLTSGRKKNHLPKCYLVGRGTILPFFMEHTAGERSDLPQVWLFDCGIDTLQHVGGLLTLNPAPNELETVVFTSPGSL